MNSSTTTLQNNEQILIDIQNLQAMEQNLFNSLETNPNMTFEIQKSTLQKINDLSNMRINIYKTLGNVSNNAKNSLDTSLHTFNQQLNAITVVETELNKSKQRLSMLEDEKNNKIRLVEINNYYGDKYHEHSQLMQIVIYTLIPVIIVNIINSYGILPYYIFITIIAIIAIIGSYYFWSRLISIIMRDNMNYDKYDWGIDPPFDPKSSETTSSDPWFSGSLPTITCIGSNCCSEGMVYDEKTDVCVIDKTANEKEDKKENKKETMEVLTKTERGKYKADVDLKGAVPMFAHYFR